MAFEFRFPDVGEGITEGVLVEWLVKEGNKVEDDQPFAKVETDKAVVEIPAPKAAVVLKLHVNEGDTIQVGDVIVTFGEEGEKLDESEAEPEKEVDEPGKKAVPEKEEAEETEPPEEKPAAKPKRPLATPHTRSLARKLGVDLKEVTPSGKGGRITDEDVEKAAKGEEAPKTPEREDKPKKRPVPELKGKLEDTDYGEVERVAASHLRKVIAKSMTESVHTSAHVTHVDEADVTELYALYKRTKERFEASGDVKLTLLPFFLKAIVATLKKHPILNASYDAEKEEIILKKYFNIGIAIDTPEGLVVPVIKNVERKDMAQLADEILTLSEKAKARDLSLEEIRGGSISVTNIGPIGGLFATPIIRQPELAIVGLHTMKEKPAVVEGEIVPRKIMYISVSFDHRIIDGANAARFATDLVELVENPELLLVRL